MEKRKETGTKIHRFLRRIAKLQTVPDVNVTSVCPIDHCRFACPPAVAFDVAYVCSSSRQYDNERWRKEGLNGIHHQAPDRLQIRQYGSKQQRCTNLAVRSTCLRRSGSDLVPPLV